MRDYRKEYDDFHGKAEQRSNRSSRNKARRKVKKLLGKKAVKGKDVDHKDGNPKNNSNANLRVRSINKNRGDKKWNH